MTNNLLLHCVKDKKKHKMWFLVDNKLVYLGIDEFALMMGLSCRSFPHGEKLEKVYAKD